MYFVIKAETNENRIIKIVLKLNGMIFVSLIEIIKGIIPRTVNEIVDANAEPAIP